MDIAARIRATGIETGSTDSKDRQICSVKCQGCGNIIRSSDDLTNVEYVKTKRKTDLFFHKECADQVWKHGII